MSEFDEIVVDTFLKNQSRLFAEPVAISPEEAEEFLEDCLAVVCKNKKERSGIILKKTRMFPR